ncbi:DNRLRE domain-containing protein [Clostridium sp.]|jgi:hypothetical protein|uniref:DNRLRE domain-containing protein n=1 Tax=Clostridium sp. TaxID=1506 RepID=UPI00258EE5E0|nr:DNRLRE domain-containing protein [Clostridium sp.]MDF2504126.1 hypothetical protein [Clostridium sp.]
MPDEKTQILCTKSLTVTDLCSEGNIEDDNLQVGFDGKNIYRSYMYFDIDKIIENSMINFVILRIFIKKISTCHTPITLYVQTLKDEFNKFTTFDNQPKYDKVQIKIKIDSDLRGWLDIDITNLFFNCSDSSENKGIIIRSAECEKSLITFASNLACNPAIIPKLYMDYSCMPRNKSSEKCIDVLEKHFVLVCPQQTTSEAINVERIIQGTFFIYNAGPGPDPVTVITETSVDLIHWVIDNQTIVNVNSSDVLFNGYYGKYYRIRLECVNPSTVDIRFIYQVYK